MNTSQPLVLSFGSCLSHLTAVQLSMFYGWKLVGNVAHNRSDQFIDYYIDKRTTPPSLADLSALVRFKPDSEDYARRILANQYPEEMGRHDLPEATPLFELLEETKIDLILLDNFMDLSAQLFEFQTGLEGKIFSNAHMFENLTDFGKLGHVLSARQSAENFVRLVQWLRARQPQAKIVVLSFQYSQIDKNAERYHRARDFWVELVKLKTEDFSICPPLHPPLDRTKGCVDWAHFEEDIYRALAGMLHLHVFAHTPLPDNNYVLPPAALRRPSQYNLQGRIALGINRLRERLALMRYNLRIRTRLKQFLK
ncbi:hypothetical protein [Asticcacaulis sp. YBE204]|uniref:hypothetical protein n=1 Tax=Asticcacaulis sp. YBE204 TaxID=1282363 RepID=UPI0003C3B66A|nr:hypothetical protein [Asticcacaulis sp. YBE204]ESQ78636.1 hypothetical protein AEYBE204_13880 [Asticcacaulis sp. YBE204]